MTSVLLCGEFWPGSLEASYADAFTRVGASVVRWPIAEKMNECLALGKWSAFVASRVRVTGWEARVNRPLLMNILDTKPDLIVVFGRTSITSGLVSQVKLALPTTRIVLVWGDSLIQIDSRVADLIKVVDCVASFCRAHKEPFCRFGARDFLWLPFAADSAMVDSNMPHMPASCDVVFIGNHKPEREAMILHLIDSGHSACVWGPKDWKRHSRNPSRVKEYWVGKQATGSGYRVAAHSGRFMVNLIDPTTFPGTNMRFFESLACGVPLICSDAFEFCEEARAKDLCLLYNGSNSDLVAKLRRELSAPDIGRVGRGIRWVLDEHTYEKRARKLIDWFLTLPR